MTEQEKEQARQAEELAAHLAGEPLPEANEQVARLAEFAQGLPWEELDPDARFRLRLRAELLEEISAGADRPIERIRARRPPNLVPVTVGRGAAAARPLDLVSVVLVVVLLAIVIIAVLALMGPRVREIFGTVYNSLSSLAPCSMLRLAFVAGPGPLL